ncbi:MAG: hypothetical protein ACRDHN_05175, partial [Thermomicrobiales bacterium]
MRFAPRFFLLLSVCAACALFPAAALADPPTTDMPPTITESSPQVGVELSFDAGMWNQPLSIYSTQWIHCTDSTDLDSCTDIDGANGNTYTPTASDRGMFIAVREIVENEFEEGNNDTSNRVGRVLWAPEVIDNGVMALGVRPLGSLNVNSQVPSNTGEDMFGLRLLNGQYDAISPGSPAEGWGVADGASEVSGWANRDDEDPGEGQENAHVVSYTNDSEEATSVSEIWDGEEAPYARITHEFSPSSVSEYLYEIDTTIEPLQLAGMTDARYRRLVDWDIEPTEYNEIVSTVVGNSPNLAAVTDDGFSST